MKYILVAFLILCVLIGISLKGKIIVVQLVLPENILPYYEWLISFPGVNPLPAPPSQEKAPSYNSYEL
jgi:hypothetical protein